MALNGSDVVEARGMAVVIYADMGISQAASFYIARWPVTVAQFRAFVEAPDKEGFRPGDLDCLRGVANQRVVWVSWHSWLLPATNNFPRAHRHTLTRRRKPSRRW